MTQDFSDIASDPKGEYSALPTRNSSEVLFKNGNVENGEKKICQLEFEQQDEDERDQWGNPLQFFFTILGFCVGLGNIWRFPYLCQANGGGAFVIPFLIMLVIEGMPLLLLELAIGQKIRKGSYMVWNTIHPWLGGIGLASTVIAIIVGCYYNVIIGWCLYFLARSIYPTLPWADCPQIPSSTDYDYSEITNTSSYIPVPECAKSSETQYFWYRTTLDISTSIDDFGGVKWWVFLCVGGAWIIVYFIIMKGIQSSGKVVYFTAMFPYVVLTIFLIRGLTLKGSGAGLAHMFWPKIDKLLSPEVWLAAANQVFYSYGLAFGSIIGFGSYNPPNKNVVMDVYSISLCNAFTAVYACAVVFAILGFKAQHLFEKCIERDKSILSQIDAFQHLNLTSLDEDKYEHLMQTLVHPENTPDNMTGNPYGVSNCSLAQELDKAAEGTGLAFIVMTDVFTMLPGAPFWSFLFFAMLLSLGLGSQIGILEGILGTFFDMPQLKGVKKPVLSAFACLICFALGVVCTTGAGEYWVALFDKYGAMGLTMIAFSEIMAVVYVYGHKRFTNDVYEMTGVKLGWYWQITLRFVAPILIAVILIFSIADQVKETPVYKTWDPEIGGAVEKGYPTWILVVAVILSLASVIPIVLIGCLRACKINILNPDAGMKRVDTSASTKQMLPSVQSFTVPTSDDDDEDGRERDSDSDKGIVADIQNVVA